MSVDIYRKQTHLNRILQTNEKTSCRLLTRIGLFIVGIYRKEHKLSRLCENKWKNRRIYLIAGFYCGTGGHCEDKRPAKSQSEDRQSDWLCQWQIPSPQAEIAVAFRWRIAYLWFVYDRQWQHMTTWGDQSLCDAMAITGIVGDRRSRYLIRQRATGSNAKLVRLHTTVSSFLLPSKIKWQYI